MRRAFALVGLDDKLRLILGRCGLVAFDLRWAGLFLHDLAVGGVERN